VLILVFAEGKSHASPSVVNQGDNLFITLFHNHIPKRSSENMLALAGLFFVPRSRHGETRIAKLNSDRG
uniref:hypothetical protein n=1 Tax=Pseudomonas viridiflava TaxID=33069 RepID=UPI00197FA741